MIKKENHVFGIVFFVLIFVLFSLIVGGRVLSSRIADYKKSLKSAETVSIAWEELYPYDQVVEELPADAAESSTAGNGTSSLTKLAGLLSNFSIYGEEWLQNFYGYDNAAALGCFFSSKLSDPSVISTYIRLNNGSWIPSTPEITAASAREKIAQYASLNNYLKGKGIDFIYFYAPWKECAVDDEYPSGAVSYANRNIDTYLDALASYGIDYVDFRQELHEEGFDHYSLFYKTDHHWKVETGLWASTVVEKKLSETLGISMIDSYNFGEYTDMVYPDAEFGSEGAGVTHSFADSEDFVVPYPTFETCYRLEIPNKGVDSTGSFRELFLNEEGIEELMEAGGGKAYEMILYGNSPYLKITNLKNPDGPKVLAIRDSFASSVAPYLAASCSELVLLDTRSGKGDFTGSIISCIEQTNPDIVIAFQREPQELTINK